MYKANKGTSKLNFVGESVTVITGTWPVRVHSTGLNLSGENNGSKFGQSESKSVITP